MRGTIPPLPNTRSWDAAKLKKSTKVIFLLSNVSEFKQNSRIAGISQWF